MRPFILSITILLMSGGAWAQPTTAPVDLPVTGARRGFPGRGRGPVDPAQRQAIIQWARENMPDLAKYAEEFGGRGRGAVAIFALIRTRMIAMEEGPDVVRERLRRNIATENQIGQYLVEMQTATPEQRAELQKKVEAAMRQNIEGFMAERQDRIDRLKNRLEMEQRVLDIERQRIDEIISRRLLPFQMALPGPAVDTPSVAPAEPSLAAPPQQGTGQ